MYLLGHFGVSSLLFLPFGAVLYTRGEPVLALVAGAVMLSFAMLPDVDRAIPLLDHRGVTHSLLFAALVGVIFMVAASSVSGVAADRGFTTAVDLATFGFMLGMLTVLAHLFADTLTPMGVAYLWPLTSRPYSLGVCRADDPVVNYALFAVGTASLSAAVLVVTDVGPF